MPTYDFHCTKCERIISEFYSMSEKPDAVLCLQCHELAQQVITGGQGFLLKGHGWSWDRYAGPSNFKFNENDND